MPIAAAQLVSQKDIIPLLQQYLDYNQYPLVLNKAGICHGLATVYLKYCAAGKIEEFVSLLKLIRQKGEIIAELKRISENQELSPDEKEKRSLNLRQQLQADSEKLNQFVMDLMIGYDPGEFDKKMGQNDSFRVLSVDIEDPETHEIAKKKLKHEYTLGLAVNGNAWRNILKKLDNDGTVIEIGSLEHTIGVYVQNGQYIVYDPNAEELYACSDSTELGALITRQIFPIPTGTPLALSINVYSNPQHAETYTFPDKEWILSKLTPAQLDGVEEFDGIHFNSLAVAAMQNDTEMMKLLFEHGAKNPEMALVFAARDNRIQSIEMLLDSQYRQHLVQPEMILTQACQMALGSGRVEAFQRFIDDKETKSYLNVMLQAEESQKAMLELAARSKNPQSIRQIVDLIKEVVPKADIAALIQSSECIALAEESGNQRCVLLLKSLSQNTPAPEVSKDDKQSHLGSDAKGNVFLRGFRSFKEFIDDLVGKLSTSFRKTEIIEPLSNLERYYQDVLGLDLSTESSKTHRHAIQYTQKELNKVFQELSLETPRSFEETPFVPDGKPQKVNVLEQFEELCAKVSVRVNELFKQNYKQDKPSDEPNPGPKNTPFS